MGTFDLEAGTYDEITGLNKDKVDLWGLYVNGQYRHFKNGIDFVDYIFDNIQDLNKTFIFAHNGGGYDFLFLIRELRNSEWRDNVNITREINGKIAELYFKKSVEGKKYRCYFRDSFKNLPSSLKNLGESFGFPKQEMPSWRENKEKGLSYIEHYNQMIDYNKNDCVCLYNIIHKFFSELDFEFKIPPLTAPSLAYKIFKKMLNIKMSSDLNPNTHLNDRFIRRAYVGGRTEVFKMRTLPSETYIYLDVNSLYPREMFINKFPIGRCTRLFSSEPATKAFLEEKPGVYEVNWIAPDIHTPILWSKRVIKKNSPPKLLFSLNRDQENHGYGFYALPELQLAKENGYMIEPLSAVIYDQTRDIFSEYVSRFIKMKYEGGAKKEVAKILLNALYGKCGQRLRSKGVVHLTPDEAQRIVAEISYLIKKRNQFEPSSKEWEDLQEIIEIKNISTIDNKLSLFSRASLRNPRDICVIWACYVSAYARCTLWKAMNASGFTQVYCDTDAVIIPKRYSNNLEIDDKELGKWKIEGYVHNGRFFSPKSYILDITKKNKKGEWERQLDIKMKGVDKEIINSLKKRGLDFNGVVDYFESLPEMHTYKVTPYRQSMRMHLEPGEARMITKELSLKYDKRQVLDDGIETVPY